MRGGGCGAGSFGERLERHAKLALDAADEADRLQARVLGNGQSEQDPLAHPGRRGNRLQAIQFPGRLDGDDTDARGDGRREFGLALARAGHGDCRGIEAGPQHGFQLATRGHIRAHAAASKMRNDRQGRVCLDRECNPECPRKNRLERSHSASDEVEVVDEERRAELFSQVGRRNPGQLDSSEDAVDGTGNWGSRGTG